MIEQSFRSKLLARRTYNRPLNEAGDLFETWAQTIERVIGHQRWLWERAQGKPLTEDQEVELYHLELLMKQRKVLVSGRTLWLGGTTVAKTREASQFNCAFGRVETVFDVVDADWLLLQGCGVGFEPVVGTLNGFTKPVEVQVIRSTRKTNGHPRNRTRYSTGKDGKRRYILQVGDSAEAWAKAVGKLLAMKEAVDIVVLDFRQIRPGGVRLKGYGWISSGDETISKAFAEICELLNRRAGQLLTRIDILDLLNLLGTTLSSRRSAEIAVVPYGDPEWEAFATAKKGCYDEGSRITHRGMSNNSLIFYDRPARDSLQHIFDLMLASGGSEPGFINGQTALKRAPWFKGVNPCAEILLGNKSFCNLVEVNLAAFNGNWFGLCEAMKLAARANYRQTCVNLDDGVLQRSWHELNQFLRLCGVGLTGIVQWEYQDDGEAFYSLRLEAHKGANSMADELGLPRPKGVCTVKPSGTLGKVMDTTEGVHKPLGKYIFNNIGFSKFDPLVEKLRAANYHVFENPSDPAGVIVRVPVSYEGVEFDVVNGMEVNLDSAIKQLERYKLLMQNYVDYNCSITVSYDPSEVPAIIDWLLENWDSYVGVSFLLRMDPTKTAKDLGFPYLPQEVVTKEAFDAYAATLLPVNIDDANSHEGVDVGSECAGGACPVR